MRARVGSLELNYEIAGPEGAPVVTFVHGLAASLGIWAGQAERLSGRFRVLRYDLRGHGGTAAPDLPCSRHDLAADLAGLLDALGIARTAVVGHSAGGVVAQQFAVDFPERVTALGFVGTASECNDKTAAWYTKCIETARAEGGEAVMKAMGMKPDRSPVPDGPGMAPVIEAMRTLNADPLTSGAEGGDGADADRRRRQGLPRRRGLGDPQPHGGRQRARDRAGPRPRPLPRGSRLVRREARRLPGPPPVLSPGPSQSRFAGRLLAALPLLAVLHLAALIAIRLWTDADDFNNWDLIGFLNANAFSSLGEVLGLREVHFANPFSFPMYNTGAESVVSTVVHRAMSGVSLYWSNTVVLVLHDLVFFAAVAGLFRFVFADALVRACAWMLVAMSPVLLTFPSTLSFDMQGFSTIALGMLGCECLLASRRAAGLALLALAFLTISQAYPLSFFLPLFCAVWTGSRAMQRAASERGLDGGFVWAVVLAAAAVVAGVMVVEAGSGGTYLAKAFGVVAAPIRYLEAASKPDVESAGRVAQLLKAAFLPTTVATGVQPAFAPFGVLAVLLALGAFAALRIRPLEGGAKPWLRGACSAAAWAGLVVFGYMPAAFGMNAKSQRCYFGDLFLVMAVAVLLGWVLRRVELFSAKGASATGGRARRWWRRWSRCCWLPTRATCRRCWRWTTAATTNPCSTTTRPTGSFATTCSR